MGKGSKVKENLMTQSITKLVAWEGGLGKYQKKKGTSFMDDMDVPIYTIGDEDYSNEIAIHEIKLHLQV